MSVQDCDLKNREINNWREYLSEIKESYRVYSWVIRELTNKQMRKWVFIGIVALSFAAIFGTLDPFLVSYVFDGLVAKDQNSIFFGLGGIIVLIVLNEICMYLFLHYRELAFGENMSVVDSRTSELFFEKSMGQHMSDDSVLSAANIEKGRARVFDVIQLMTFEGIPVIFETLIAFVFLCILFPIAGLIVTGLWANYIIWTFFMNRKIIVECTPIEAEWRSHNRHRIERWDNIERVKTSGMGEREIVHMREWFDDILSKDRKFWLWFINMILVRSLINRIAVVAIIVYGAWNVWNGFWSIGLLYPLYRWSWQIWNNMWRFGHIEHRLNWNMPSIRSMMQALTTKPDIVNEVDAVYLKKDDMMRVEIVSLTHKYPTKRENGACLIKKTKPILKDVSFTIEPGEKVALIGSSGAGKTTLIRLLQRYMDPDSGCIKINGHDLCKIKLESFASLIGYIPQQAQVLDGTIRYNMLYGMSEQKAAEISDDDLWVMMKKLQIDFGERLTEGLDTIVGRRGIKLSGGQAQRLMIGAAVLRSPKLLLVDEATSSLDSTTEKAVQNGLSQVLDSNTGALIITHRLSTVRKLCSKFIVLREVEELKNGDSQIKTIADSFGDLYITSPTFRRLADGQGVVI